MFQKDTRPTILLVDDDPDFLHVIAAQVEAGGHWQIYIANDGEEAVAQIEALSQIDVLITDFHMPGVDGLDVAMAFRDQFPNAPVILTTAATSMNDRIIKLLEIPRTKFLKKPFLMSDLQMMLENLKLGKARSLA
ncbi:MAG: response regulator [Bdellovibrionales bacterium]|nr:response regulator [Bdellovibrionales bacterium]